jgi:hypothetical protein
MAMPADPNNDEPKVYTDVKTLALFLSAIKHGIIVPHHYDMILIRCSLVANNLMALQLHLECALQSCNTSSDPLSDISDLLSSKNDPPSGTGLSSSTKTDASGSGKK